MRMATRRLHTWDDWYRFARQTLGHTHDEAVTYANLRFVEEQNRQGGTGARAA